MLSINSSKGSEWPVVAILTSEPKEKISQEDLEMESKLAYVVATRATLKLIKAYI